MTEPLPPVLHRLMADLDARLMQQIIDVAQRQREPDKNVTAMRMIRELVLKYRKGERFVIAEG